MQPWENGISAVTMFVADTAAAKHFYQDALGLPVLFEDEDSVVFKFGDVLVNLLVATAAPELIAPADVGAAGAGARFALTIPVLDVDAACRDLIRRGVRLLNGPMDRPWGPRTASFQDPDGHIWELAQ